MSAASARRGRAAARRPGAAVPPARVAATDLPVTHPALLATLIVAALCVVVSASYRLYDTDFWHLLALGRATLSGGIPRVDAWTWPLYGEPAFVSSWAFRAWIWMLWDGAGVPGLYAWRWVVALATFAFVFAAARVLGARGLSAVVVVVASSLLARQRSDIRPEAVAALLLAIVLWLLERERRRPAPSRAVWWIPAIACAWANLHISWYLGFVLLGLHLAGAVIAARRAGAEQPAAAARARRLAWVGLAAFAASFLNPYGAEALARPFRFALSWRSDPLFAQIAELQPLPWTTALAHGLWVWPMLMAWRARRRGWDPIEVAACAIFTALALSSLRFEATWALVACPFVARDLHDAIVSRRWRLPVWPLPARAALAAAASVALCVPAWADPNLPLGIGLDPRAVPEKACDFMADHGVRGRGFNHFHLGGYLAWRFYGQRERLPFMSTQPELARPADRALYVAALGDAGGWRTIDARYRFDWALLDREQLGDDVMLDILDRDTSWALVFADDAAELLVRRDGASRAAADSFAYRLIPAGREGRFRLGVACEADPALRARASAELDRMIASSPWNSGASHLRGFFALMDRDLPAARRHLEHALALNPRLPGVRERLRELEGAAR